MIISVASGLLYPDTNRLVSKKGYGEMFNDG